MALPTLQRKLFQNDGYGPLLKDEIVDRRISVQNWSDTYDYSAGVFARGSDGAVYMSVQPSGPSTSAANPVQDDGTFWQKQLIETPPSNDSSSKAATTEWVNAFYSEKLVPFVLYVDAANGDDANDGYTAATAKRSLAAVYAVLESPYFLHGSYVEVYIAPGTYYDHIHGISGLNIYFYNTSSSDVIIAHTSGINVNNDMYIGISGRFTLINNGNLSVSYGGKVNLQNSAYITFSGFNGAAPIYIYNNGQVYAKNGVRVTFNFVGNCTATYATLRVTYNSFFNNFGTITWSGTVTGGKRYGLYGNATVSGIGTNSIPGASAGTVGDVSYFS